MLDRLGIDVSRPLVVFVGRITRQKGVPHLLRAGLDFDPRAQIVLLAGAADTPELGRRDRRGRRRPGRARDGVFRVTEMLPREDVGPGAQPRHGLRVPVGLRAAGHRQPGGDGLGEAVVASDVGGIPEVVDDGVTGCWCTTTPALAGRVREAGLARR